MTSATIEIPIRAIQGVTVISAQVPLVPIEERMLFAERSIGSWRRVSGGL